MGSVISRGHVCANVAEFNALMVAWLGSTAEKTVGADFQEAYVTVPIGGVPCQLSGSSTRAGVQAYLSALVSSKPRYSVVASSKGVIHRVAVGDTLERISGFYLYTIKSFASPLLLEGDEAPGDGRFGVTDVGILILDAVAVLHSRGHQRLRILPGMSGSGLHWRTAVTPTDNLQHQEWTRLLDGDAAFHYTTADEYRVAGHRVGQSSTPDELADAILEVISGDGFGRDWEYAGWYVELMGLIHRHQQLPIAYADYFDDESGWEIGWGTGIRINHPPASMGGPTTF